MKHLIATGVLAAGIFAMPVSEANAQYYYGGYTYPVATYYSTYPSYYSYGYPSYYSSPGLSLSFSYYDNDRRDRRYRYRRGDRDRYDRRGWHSPPSRRPVPYGPGRRTTW